MTPIFIKNHFTQLNIYLFLFNTIFFFFFFSSTHENFIQEPEIRCIRCTVVADV